MKKILVIEDDPAIVQGLKETLTMENFSVLTANDGEKGYRMAKEENVSLIILDLMLPKKNGMDICRDLRKDNIATPILMLTSKKQEIDKVLGLEIGADDYMTKPFSIKELLARIKAILRRQSDMTSALDEAKFDDIAVDFKRQEASKGKKQLHLSAKEFQLLKYFLEHEGIVVTRSQLLDDVWGFDVAPTTRTVDNYILGLRKKIETKPSRPKHLITVPTAGYKFVK
ncbi:MAG: response regulator transcription factor [Bacteroidota bacterium]|nr:response regulator transcription factor [Bacteroidota bacterium]